LLDIELIKNKRYLQILKFKTKTLLTWNIRTFLLNIHLNQRKNNPIILHHKNLINFYNNPREYPSRMSGVW